MEYKEKESKSRKEVMILMVACLVYIIFITFIFTLKLYTLRSSAFDLGIFLQAFYSIFDGKLLYASPDFQIFGAKSFLGIHFSPIAFLVAAIYLIHPSWITIIIFQAFTVAIASLLLYKLSYILTGCARKSLILSLVYLLNPLIVSANLYDYHLESLGPLLYFTMYYYYLKKSAKYLLFGLLLALVNEGFILIVLFFSLSIIIKIKLGNTCIVDKCYRAAIILLLLCIFLLPVSIFTMHSFLARDFHGYVSDVLNFYLSDLSYNLHLKILFWILSLMSLGFLPLYAPYELIPTIPYVLVSFLSRYEPFYVIGWQYSFFYMPTFFVATANSLRKRSFTPGTLTIILGFSIAMNPVTMSLLKIPAWAGGYDLELDFQKAMRYMHYIEKISDMIEPNSTTLASARVFPFVANNLNSFVIVEGNLTGEQLNNYLRYTPKTPTYIFLDDSYTPVLELLHIDMERFGTLAQAECLLLAQLDYRNDLKFYVPYSKFLSPDNFYVHKHIAYRKIKDESFNIVYHYGRGMYENNETIFYGPYITLPRGIYVARFYLKFSGIPDNLDNLSGIFYIDVNRYAQGIISDKKLLRGQIVENQWIEVNLTFSINDLVFHNVEFRGTALVNDLDVYFAGVKVEQISPYLE